MRAPTPAPLRARPYTPWLAAACSIAAACRAAPPRAEAAAPAASRDASAPEAANDLTVAMRAFPHSDLTPAYEGDDPEALLSILRTIASGGSTADIAFATDLASARGTSLELQRALGVERARLASNSRVALVSCANDSGAWRGRIESDFTANPYELLRAARRMNLKGNPGRGAFWSCLDQVTRLRWGDPGSAKRHIVLFTDDRAHPEVIEVVRAPPINASVRKSVVTWAAASQAALHVLPPAVSDLSGEMEPYQPIRERGIPLAQIAGLFRLGSITIVPTRAELAPALERGLTQVAGAPGPVDVAVAVDRSGLMGAALGDLRRARPMMERFLAPSGHRLALITWGHGPPTIAAPLTNKVATVVAAMTATKRGPPGDWPKHVVEAVGAARGLAWNPTARKAVVVLAHAPGLGVDPGVLEWTDDASVTVLFIAGGQGF